jgi:hypothetical protein
MFSLDNSATAFPMPEGTERQKKIFITGYV